MSVRHLSRVLVAASLAGCTATTIDGDDTGDSGDGGGTPLTLRAVTFNTGTSTGLGHDLDTEDGYTSEHAAWTDEAYGNAMSWPRAEEAATAWMATTAPDIVAFQEILYDPLCAEITPKPELGLRCATYTPGGPTQPQRVLGEGWQVACHPGAPDKCLGVRTAFATLDGCDDDLCLEGLEGTPIDGCGSTRARVARARLTLADGSALTVVSVHGSSGIAPDDMACREKQYLQVFDDAGDGAPLADGERNLVLGDFNTDPVAYAAFDASAAVIAGQTDADGPFTRHTRAGDDGPKSYGGLADIDHVLSDAFDGGCWHAGLEGHPPVLDAVFFDHRPAVCDLTLR